MDPKDFSDVSKNAVIWRPKHPEVLLVLTASIGFIISIFGTATYLDMSSDPSGLLLIPAIYCPIMFLLCCSVFRNLFSRPILSSVSICLPCVFGLILYFLSDEYNQLAIWYMGFGLTASLLIFECYWLKEPFGIRNLNWKILITVFLLLLGNIFGQMYEMEMNSNYMQENFIISTRYDSERDEWISCVEMINQKYILNTISKEIHLRSCTDGQHISNEAIAYITDEYTIEAALDDGYTFCNHCLD